MISILSIHMKGKGDTFSCIPRNLCLGSGTHPREEIHLGGKRLTFLGISCIYYLDVGINLGKETHLGKGKGPTSPCIPSILFLGGGIHPREEIHWGEGRLKQVLVFVHILILVSKERDLAYGRDSSGVKYEGGLVDEVF